MSAHMVNNGTETFWFFDDLEKHLNYNSQFIVSTTGNTVDCIICNLHLPVTLERPLMHDTCKEQFSKFVQHIKGKVHLQNVTNHIFNTAFPSIWQVNNQYQIVSEYRLYCLICKTYVVNIREMEKTIKCLKEHTNGAQHKCKSVLAEKIASTEQTSKPPKTTGTILKNVNHQTEKNVETGSSDHKWHEPAASASVLKPNSTTVLCSVCESQIQIYNHDVAFSYDLHKQSDLHIIKEIVIKYENGDRKNLLTEIFNVYPTLFDELVQCGLFVDKVYYLWCNVCEKHISCDNKFPSSAGHIYNHLKSSELCQNMYIRKVLSEHFSKQKDFRNESSHSNKKDTVKNNADRLSELFRCLPPHLKSNECVISSVGNSLYCTVCKCYIKTSADKSQTLAHLKVHLETIHFENFLKKVFDVMPEEFQSSRQFIFYKEDVIVCGVCTAVMTYSPVKIKETSMSILGHLKGKRHQSSLKEVVGVSNMQPNETASVVSNVLQETTDILKGNIDKFIKQLLPHKPEIASLLKKNSVFLKLKSNDFVCNLCDKKLGVTENIKGASNNITSHFRSNGHSKLAKSIVQNNPLWKLVYDCYAPGPIKDNAEYIVRAGNHFKCTLCSFIITEQKSENIMKQLVLHLKSSEHNLVKVFANISVENRVVH